MLVILILDIQNISVHYGIKNEYVAFIKVSHRFTLYFLSCLLLWIIAIRVAILTLG